jgi:hypothetical protein
VHFPHYFEGSQKPTRDSCVVPGSLQFVDDLHLAEDMLTGQGSVLFSLLEMLFQHGPVHAQDYLLVRGRLSPDQQGLRKTATREAASREAAGAAPPKAAKLPV